jgi:hypothetical protein
VLVLEEANRFISSDLYWRQVFYVSDTRIASREMDGPKLRLDIAPIGLAAFHQLQILHVSPQFLVSPERLLNDRLYGGLI